MNFSLHEIPKTGGQQFAEPGGPKSAKPGGHRSADQGFPSGVQVVALGNLCGDEKDELILGRDSTLYICTVVEDSVGYCFHTV